ncbi:MAG: disulfide bond formation protein B [Ardenticatenia bacterium]|nr:MAG: disulfide bond formation protein B [Ardenticatenia bacterium]
MNSARVRAFLPLFAWIVALTAMSGSLYYSEVRGFIPCTLCWYQRILMYPLVAIILVGILRRDEGLPLYVLPLSVLGMFVSTYHYLLQIGVLTETGTCKAGVPCTVKYVNYFGFVTIPFMALTAFYLISMAMAAYWFMRQQDM